MALDLRRSALGVFGVVALFLAPSCVVEEKGDDDDDGGCEVDFDCKNGQICDDGRCIADPGSAGSGSGTAGSGSGTAGSGTAGSGTAGGGSGSAGTSSTGGSGGSGSGVSGSSSSGGSGGSTAACSEDDPITCPSADEMTLCIDGALETWTCEEGCVDYGFELGPCMEPNGCDCGDVLDDECALGVSALCSCDETCTDEDAIVLYIACYQNEPPEIATALRCLTDYVDEAMETVDCDAGLEACAPAEEE